MTVASNTATERVAKLFAALPALVDADAHLVRRGRYLTCDFEIGIAEPPLEPDYRITSGIAVSF